MQAHFGRTRHHQGVGDPRPLALAANDERIDIEFREFAGMIEREGAYAKDAVDCRVDIGPRSAAVAVEQREQLQPAQRRLDLVGRTRQQQGGAVLEQLDHHAAGTDGHHWAEQRIAGDADDQFGDAARDHALDIESAAQASDRRGGFPHSPESCSPTLTAPASDLWAMPSAFTATG